MSNVTAVLAAPRSAFAQTLDPRNVLTLAGKEIRDSLRNRWFLLYAGAFAAVSLALSSLSLVGTGFTGFAGFGRTAASLINVIMLLVPLMALTAGASAIAGERERGTLNYLLAQPISRIEVMLGKYLGLAAAITAALTLGFGLSAAVIAWRSEAADAWSFFRLVALALALALSMLSVGMLISVLAPRPTTALGAVIFLWLALVFLGDLGLMGSAIAFQLEVDQLFNLSLINPLQVFKMAAIGSLHASLDVLGPAGLYATRRWGDSLDLLFGALLAAWIIVPLAVASAIFVRRGGA